MIKENGEQEPNNQQNGQTTRMASNQNFDEYLLDDLPDEISDDGTEQSETLTQNPSGRTEESDETPARTNFEFNEDGPPRVRLINKNGEVVIKPIEGPEEIPTDFLSEYLNVFGTDSIHRIKELIYRIFDFTEFIDGLNRRQMVMNRILAQLDEMNINSEMEATQAYQMLIADEIQQQMARKGMLADQVELKEFYFEWAERFMQQSTDKIESFQDLQEEAEQTIRVERVDVSDGGQAVVGNFNQEGEGDT